MALTLTQKKVFLRDMRYVLDHARAFKDYVGSGTKAALLGHPFEQTIHNALLESSLSFLRKINEFFGSNRAASVSVFIPEYPKQWLWGREDVDLLNERVMHLSLAEAKEGKMDWATFYLGHLDEAERRFESFFAELEQNYPEYTASGPPANPPPSAAIK